MPNDIRSTLPSVDPRSALVDRTAAAFARRKRAVGGALVVAAAVVALIAAVALQNRAAHADPNHGEVTTGRSAVAASEAAYLGDKSLPSASEVFRDASPVAGDEPVSTF